MEIILSLAYTLLFIFLLLRLKSLQLTGIPRYYLPLLFVVKILAGIALWYLYSYHYTNRSQSDIFKYFDDGHIMAAALNNHPLDYLRMLLGRDADPYFQTTYYSKMQVWTPHFSNASGFEAHSMVRLNAIFFLLSGGGYQVHNVLINILSFLGLYMFFKTFRSCANGYDNYFLLALFLLPTLLFWGSGVLRESLCLFLIGYNVWFFQQATLKPINLTHLTGLAMTLLLLVFVKAVIATLLILASTAYILVRKTNHKYSFIPFIALPIALLIGLQVLATYTTFNFFQLLAQKQLNFINASQAAKSAIEIPLLQPTLESCMYNAPSAIFRMLTQPFSFSTNTLYTLASIENGFILASFLLIVLKLNPTFFKQPIYWYCLLIVLGYYIITGETTPNLGSLVRYKTPVLPFLIVTIMGMIKPNLLQSKQSSPPPFQHSNL